MLKYTHPWKRERERGHAELSWRSSRVDLSVVLRLASFSRRVLLYQKIFTLALFLFISTSQLLSVDSQIEFVAEITAIDTSGEFTVLTVAITPEVRLDVLISDQTEIHDPDSGPLAPAALEVGQSIKVEGIFTDLGLLALEIELSSDGDGFTLKGPIQSIGEGQIEVQGLQVIVPPEAEISDIHGPLAFGELEVGQLVKVSGMVVEGRLVARRIKVGRERDRHSPIRFEGIVRELPAPDLMIVEIPGEVGVQVLLTPDTEIVGSLAVGVRVRVFGHVGTDLAVVARRVVVLRLLELIPRRIEMKPDSEHRMVALLGAVFDRDIAIALSSSHPEIAKPLTDVVVVPAGRLSAIFHIGSGPDEGETEIVAELPADLGSVQARSHVRVIAERPHPELEIKWSPDKIRAAPHGDSVARLHLSRPAPRDIRVPIEQTRGDEDFVVFPDEVLIPEGERTVRVSLEFLKDQGEALLVASLPEDLGGDSAELEIEFKPKNDVKVRLSWRPEKLEADLESEVRSTLVLDAPAPAAFRVVLSIRLGNADLLRGLPAQVEFAEGQQEAVVQFKTGPRAGRITIRAAVPRSLGGDHADLKVAIDN